jgi:hypothetical protein
MLTPLLPTHPPKPPPKGDGSSLYLPSTGPLTAKEYKERLVTSEGTQTVYLPESKYTIRYAYVSQRGYYPDSPDKLNQVGGGCFILNGPRGFELFERGF